jgi:hypothetical protein
MSTTLTLDRPIEGPAYDKSKPETRQPWLDFRRPGLTATMIRDWGNGSRRRKILEEKATGEFEDLSHIAAVNHGNRREPVIAEWVRGRFGIEPCDSVYARADNTRHLASPDGVSLDPYSRELLVGVPEAILEEIKTSKHDLTPGRMDAERVLIEVAIGSDFDRAGYYTQMQWQMYVMNSPMTLFVYEQHDNVIDPITGTFTPIGPPEWAWVPRNDTLIDALLANVAPKALAEIDKALAIRSEELPPASKFPAEHAVLVADVLKARDEIAVADKVRESAWETLDKAYPDDCSHDLGFASLTVSSGTGKEAVKDVTDFDGMAKRAPKLVAQYEALKARYTKPQAVPGKPYRKMTITRKDQK